MDFDAVLVKCGNFGRYQLVLLLFYGCTNILSSLHYFAQTIISFTPEHWCYHEKLANASISYVRSIYAQTADPQCTLLEDIVDDRPIVAAVGKCTEWIYAYDRGYHSITTDLKWICNDAYQAATGQSFFFLGSIIGTIFFGILADKIGRLPALICTTLTGAFGDFLTSFVTSLPAFAMFRFVSGLSNDTIFYLMYIMVFEYLSPEKRTFGLNVITAIFYCFGLVLSPWYAIWVGSWRYYLYIASLPALIVLLYPLFICESAQWLIATERYDRAVNCLRRVAKFNKRRVEEDVFTQFRVYYEEKMALDKKFNRNEDTFWGMFRTPRLRKFTIILLLKSMIITISFDVISRNMEGLGSSPFTLFSVSSLAYIPGGLTIIFLQNRIGRKGMAFGSLFVSAIIVTVTGFMIAFLDPEKNTVLLAIMVALGRYGVIVSYDAEAQYAAEFIPTTVRGRGLANIHVIGYGFAMLSSYVIYLGLYFKPLPSVVISAVMLCGALLCLALPETLNQKLPETLKDGEDFARHQRWYYFPCFNRVQTNNDDVVE
ncbi:PREDICTED: organic cation transporter-like protein [Bactrocera latifrons]|uniref:Organic cation transporter-like protein n=1 Tax=Bactrocera latifrons TaxID=174628 RepID=A0A0K8V8Z1_BACLA|nr:PREDICTED: organic cation transporter-like protein [Bactrocera latifrons]